MGSTGPSTAPAAAALLAVAAAFGCGTGPGITEETVDRPEVVAPAVPFVRVLGTAQDGGLPHVACSCKRCDAARSDPSRARAVAALAIVDPESGSRYLVDATPDIRPQLDRLRTRIWAITPAWRSSGTRPPTPVALRCTARLP